MNNVNTVTISLEDYNILRDFKKNIEDGKSVYFTYHHINAYKYYSKDEDVIRLNSEIQSAFNEIEKLYKKNEDLKKELIEKISLVANYKLLFDISHVERFKKMGIIEFIKWKISNK